MSCRDYEDDLLDLARGLLADGRRERLSEHTANCAACAARLGREVEVSAALRALADATSERQPSPGVETRLLEQAARLWPAEVVAPSSIVNSPSSSPRQARGEWRWLWAAAAVFALVAGGAAGWRAWFDASRLADAGAPPLVSSEARTLDSPSVDATGQAGGVVGRPESRPVDEAMPRAPRPGATRGSRPVAPPAAAAEVEFVAWPGARALPPFESGELIRTELPVGVLPLLGLRSEGAGRGSTVTADVIVGQDRLPRAVRLLR